METHGLLSRVFKRCGNNKPDDNKPVTKRDLREMEHRLTELILAINDKDVAKVQQLTEQLRKSAAGLAAAVKQNQT